MSGQCSGGLIFATSSSLRGEGGHREAALATAILDRCGRHRDGGV